LDELKSSDFFSFAIKTHSTLNTMCCCKNDSSKKIKDLTKIGRNLLINMRLKYVNKTNTNLRAHNQIVKEESMYKIKIGI